MQLLQGVFGKLNFELNHILSYILNNLMRSYYMLLTYVINWSMLSQSIAYFFISHRNVISILISHINASFHWYFISFVCNKKWFNDMPLKNVELFNQCYTWEIINLNSQYFVNANALYKFIFLVFTINVTQSDLKIPET